MLESTRTSINYSKHPILQKIGVAFKIQRRKKKKNDRIENSFYVLRHLFLSHSSSLTARDSKFIFPIAINIDEMSSENEAMKNFS